MFLFIVYTSMLKAFIGAIEVRSSNSYLIVFCAPFKNIPVHPFKRYTVLT